VGNAAKSLWNWRRESEGFYGGLQGNIRGIGEWGNVRGLLAGHREES